MCKDYIDSRGEYLRMFKLNNKDNHFFNLVYRNYGTAFQNGVRTFKVLEM